MRSLVSLVALTLLGGCALVDPSRNVTIGEERITTRSDSARLGSSAPRLTTPGAPAASAHGVHDPDDATSGFFSLSRGELWARWNALRGDPYELDAVERRLEAGERATCDPKTMVVYRGSRLRYAGALTVSEPFKARLERFEEVAAEVAREVYGREPSRIRHYGAYSCRSTRNRSWLVSEHALGNALDLVGFDFGPENRQQPLAEGLPASLKHPFQVRVGKHWAKTDGTAAVHARFLQRLTDRLHERDDIFRCMFGPGHGGHDDHLHLDVAPYRYVDL